MLLPEQRKLLKALKITTVEANGEWSVCRCPLAPWRHAGGKDSNPSFGIKIAKSNVDTRYNCFTCGGGSSVHELVATLHMYCKNSPIVGVEFDFKAAQDIIAGLDTQLAPIPDWEEFRASEYAEYQEWPQWFIDVWTPGYLNADCAAYLTERGVTAELAHTLDLRYDPVKTMVVMPYRNMYGKLSGARGRSIDPNCAKEWKHFDYTWNGVNNNALVWCGEEAIMAEQPLVVVEGQFDLMKVRQVWPYTMALLSTKVTDYKQKKLLHAVGVVLMTDDDKPGHLARDKLTRFLTAHNIPVAHFTYPPAPIGQDGQPIKQDPGMLSVEQIREGLKDLLPV